MRNIGCIFGLFSLMMRCNFAFSNLKHFWYIIQISIYKDFHTLYQGCVEMVIVVASFLWLFARCLYMVVVSEISRIFTFIAHCCLGMYNLIKNAILYGVLHYLVTYDVDFNLSQLTLNRNNPKLREFFLDEISWTLLSLMVCIFPLGASNRWQWMHMLKPFIFNILTWICFHVLRKR